MSQLRPHQLRHPELVTEGMNRLAQALICLSDSDSRHRYDTDLGLIPATGTPEQPSLPYELLEPSETHPVPIDRVTESVIEGVLVVERPPAYEVVEPFVARPIPQAEVWQPANRRQLYARLVALRRLLAAWQELRFLVANPGEALDRPISVLRCLEATRAAHTLFTAYPDVIPAIGEPGSKVVALIRQPQVLAIHRTLLTNQRQALAMDWHRGERFLMGEQRRLRAFAQSTRPRRPRSNVLVRCGYWLIRRPEVVLLVLVVGALLRAAFR